MVKLCQTSLPEFDLWGSSSPFQDVSGGFSHGVPHSARPGPMAPPKLPAIHGRLDDFYGFFPTFPMTLEKCFYTIHDSSMKLTFMIIDII